ncbi:NAD(P)-binding protein [Cucurbitaria berberidis CBS 394.84]|uniref:NAD(P)-binding protein n=1 Tax=Cucurbitaria berberidis CBS 394.84 TaxID=1168544 RepID=A0A9P4L6M2_9PLEO|nr:NAD(P)-binding protein [Cucurbitaria berberidis CBS 394.84]KAF1843439.1 NAD(P)-binding protein [Cucurbitaria berberidis CBS 394.84]
MTNNSIVLITGGNTGIGYETVKALYASPQAHTILMGSRSLEKAQDAISTLKSEISDSKSEIIPLQIDIEDDASIENAFKQVESTWGKVDALVNNAGGSYDGIVLSKPGPSGIREAWNKAYSVNVTSTQVFTHQFAPLLLASSNPYLLFISSGLSSLTTCSGGFTSKIWSDPSPKGWPKPAKLSPIAYRSSKTALNMMMLEWKRLLEPDGVKVFCISPGFLATNLGGMGADFLKKVGAGDASVGGVFIKDVVEGKRDEDTGKVINKDGVQPW